MYKWSKADTYNSDHYNNGTATGNDSISLDRQLEICLYTLGSPQKSHKPSPVERAWQCHKVATNLIINKPNHMSGQYPGINRRN